METFSENASEHPDGPSTIKSTENSGINPRDRSVTEDLVIYLSGPCGAGGQGYPSQSGMASFKHHPSAKTSVLLAMGRSQSSSPCSTLVLSTKTPTSACFFWVLDKCNTEFSRASNNQLSSSTRNGTCIGLSGTLRQCHRLGGILPGTLFFIPSGKRLIVPAIL